MDIQAVFKGQDGSEGYKKGEEYFFRLKGMRIYPHPNSKCKSVSYATIEAFLNNWRIVKVY